MVETRQKTRSSTRQGRAPKPVLGRSFLRKWLPTCLGLLGALGLGAALYGYTLGFSFQYDDESYLLRNPLLNDFSSFFSIFDFHRIRQVIADRDLPMDVGTNFILRPLTYLTFYLNHLVAGGWSEAGCRVVNIAIHGLNGFLVFQLLSSLLRSSPKASSLRSSSTIFIPAAGAALFLVHPVQVEAVTYIAQRFTSLGTLFYLLALLLYFQAGAAQGRVAWLVRAGSVLAMVAGLLSKEEPFTIPLMLILLDRLVMDTPWKTVLRRTLPHVVCMLGIPALILALSISDQSNHRAWEHALTIACPPEMADYSFSYLLTEVRVVLIYLGLLFVPSRLNVDWDIENSTSLTDHRVLASAGGILAILVLAWLFYRRARHEVRHALFFVSVLWFFVTVSVSSSFIPLPDVMADHRVYLPSIGIFVALAAAADVLRTEFFRNRRWSWSVPVGVAACVAGFCAATVVRNNVWRSGISLWTDSTLKSPEKFRPWGNLGVHYGVKGQMDEAKACLEKAIALKADYLVGYRNLAIILNDQARYDQAIKVLEVGLRQCGEDTVLRYDMALAYCATGRLNQGVRELQLALRKNPNHFLCHFSLGDIYAKQGKFEAAVQEYANAGKISPGDKRVLARIATIQGKTRSLAGR